MALSSTGNSKIPIVSDSSKLQLAPPRVAPNLPWIETRPGHPYFVTDTGKPWTPIGQNDAITWPELEGLFRRKDTKAAEAYLQMLAAHGVTCLRLMLEYNQGASRHIEKPAGRFQPNMVRLWDDLFALCAQYGIRILLTPFDTFWMWIRWKKHPYNRLHGGPCDKRSQWLLCAQTRAAIKQRLLFATERWGGTGVLFAWDLWNEIHPAHGGNSAEGFHEFVADVGGFLRDAELRLHGKAHPQTVSVFGPVLNSHPDAAGTIFRHPMLDFASTHFYESKTIDYPRNTVDAAISAGRLTAEALAQITDGRPFFDSEHGPIHSFKDRRITLPEPFDDEYFRHIQWAHFASGGAGGGMRWPNRHPHSLTAGMRKAQQGLALFLSLIDWNRFVRRNWNEAVKAGTPEVAVFACGDEHHAIVWLLRKTGITKNGILRSDLEPLRTCVHLPFATAGTYRVTAMDTASGSLVGTTDHVYDGAGACCISLPAFRADLALAVARIE